MAPTTTVTATTAPNPSAAATTTPVKPPKRKYQPRLRFKFDNKNVQTLTYAIPLYYSQWEMISFFRIVSKSQVSKNLPSIEYIVGSRSETVVVLG